MYTARVAMGDLETHHRALLVAEETIWRPRKDTIPKTIFEMSLRELLHLLPMMRIVNAQRDVQPLCFVPSSYPTFVDDRAIAVCGLPAEWTEMMRSRFGDLPMDRILSRKLEMWGGVLAVDILEDKRDPAVVREGDRIIHPHHCPEGSTSILIQLPTNRASTIQDIADIIRAIQYMNKTGRLSFALTRTIRIQVAVDFPLVSEEQARMNYTHQKVRAGPRA